MHYSYEIWNAGEKGWSDTFSKTVRFEGTELAFRQHLDSLELSWQYTKNIKAEDGTKIERLRLETRTLSYVESMPKSNLDEAIVSRKEELYAQYNKTKADISFIDFVIERLIATEEI